MKKIFHLLPTFVLLPLLLLGTACAKGTEENGSVLPPVTVTDGENAPAVSAVPEADYPSFYVCRACSSSNG